MKTTYDLAIVGAGPAGLSLAQYASTRGLRALVLEGIGRIGGRAATSPLLENVPGFPEGISGSHLSERLFEQATRLGAVIFTHRRVEHIQWKDEYLELPCKGAETFRARHVVLACGLTPRRGTIPGVSGLSALFYEPPASFARYEGKTLCVYGGGNASGQTVLALSRAKASHIDLVVREKNLHDSMAAYLVERIAKLSQVRIHLETEIESVRGVRAIEAVCLKKSSGMTTIPTDGLIVLLGGEPKLDWLPEDIARNAEGYVVTNSRYETTMPGVYAIGDMCSGRGYTVMAAYGDAARVLQSIR
jgi:thioredoxin reductase (NADPH)